MSYFTKCTDGEKEIWGKCITDLNWDRFISFLHHEFSVEEMFKAPTYMEFSLWDINIILKYYLPNNCVCVAIFICILNIPSPRTHDLGPNSHKPYKAIPTDSNIYSMSTVCQKLFQLLKIPWWIRITQSLTSWGLWSGGKTDIKQIVTLSQNQMLSMIINAMKKRVRYPWDSIMVTGGDFRKDLLEVLVLNLRLERSTSFAT